jgi:hypothetical protein
MERVSNRNSHPRIAAQLWAASPVLTASSLLMIVALAASLVGLIVDPRMITGAPAWLKPAKFAVSTAIYMLTLAWMFTWLPEWRRTRGVIGWITAVVFVVEVAIIGLQAWRGTTSHFNIGTVFDAVLFAVMGGPIVVQTLASVAVAIALCRQTFEDRALGWAMRVGMIVAIIGASTGALMTRPTAAQLELARVSGRIAVAGVIRSVHLTAGRASWELDGARPTATFVCRTSWVFTRCRRCRFSRFFFAVVERSRPCV